MTLLILQTRVINITGMIECPRCMAGRPTLSPAALSEHSLGERSTEEKKHARAED